MVEFLAMGGYAAYVWPAFAFALVVMAGLFAQSWRAARRVERDLVDLRAAVRRPGSDRRPAATPLVARREGPGTPSGAPVSGARGSAS